MKRIVVKFGGTSLGDGGLISRAATSVYQEHLKGTHVAVVVSAIGHSTDQLVELAKVSTGGKISASEMDDIMSMGERTSARIFAAALRSLGANAEPIDPSSGLWPIITDSNFGCARMDMDETRRMIRRKILPLMRKGTIPVICGFLGRDKRGRVTTIGRGGSDVTGFLLGKCIEADEVIIVTDVEGVMSADPGRIEQARLIERITAEEMRDLSTHGARVLHPRSLEFKDPDIEAKVIHFRHGDLSASGTTIVGPKGAGMSTGLYDKPLAMLTVVGEGMQLTPSVLVTAAEPLGKAGINILGVSIGPRSFSLYVDEQDSQRALQLLHDVIARNELMKSVTSEERIAMMVAESERFIDTPGIIARLTDPLARGGINIIEILSSRASITFFVSWGDRDRAFDLLKKTMKEVCV